MVRKNPMESTKFDLIDALLADSVRNAIKYYGIEGCEEAINRVYTQNPTLKARILATFCRIYKKNS